MIGKTISHYKILEKLGGGSMGVVYKAEDTKLKRKVVLKFLPPDLTRDPESKQRFVQEAQAASALDHPSICTIYEIDEAKDGQMFISMACYEGETLKKKIKQGPLEVAEAIHTTIQVAQGLAKAHSKEIVHRDIKPANILITEDGQAKILDFGLAKLVGQTRITKVGMAVGTVSYMSPEQARGGEVDHQTDIWSLGVVLYEMLTGQLPFKGEHWEAVLYSIFHQEPEPIGHLRHDVPAALQEVVEKMMQKDVRNRYKNMNALITDLSTVDLGSSAPLVTIVEEESSPSIAVLPFVDMSPQKDQEYFCDGMAEEIINGLTKLDGLRVVARTSAFSFKGKDVDIREIGRKLKVETLLEGSVRKAGNRLRITAQLVNVADGYHLWSERYDREMEDVFAIQDEISLAIVDKLKVKLSRGEKTKLLKRYTDNLEAHSLYLKGRYFWNKRTEGRLRKAIECFEQAIEKDPGYASAYTGLADCYNLLPFPAYGGWLPKEAYPRARTAALKALEIDSMAAEAHTSLAAVKYWYDWDWSAAERRFRRAIGLNPGYATAHHWYSNMLGVVRRFDEAIAEMKRALELDPVSVIINTNLGDCLYWTRRYDEAIEQYRETLQMDSEFFYAHEMLGRAYLQKEMFKEAVEEFRKAGSPSSVFAYAASGKKDQALAVLEELIERSRQQRIDPTLLANAYLGLHEIDPTFEALEKAHQERSPELLTTINVDPLYDSLRSDPRFTALLRKMGLDN